ncbi:hypothetical protein Cgig2_027268 [Carnegiea gigantea]|uniref:Reverse transcriptase domain-containing protein n=1 Tax=Carnegiea gigantea TaxID=171969 RepID=A0A9Q1GMJ2_9CARY|nr:hypothetical protein Cgig2_027268 [Carnegiea gigantea]
MARGGKRGRPKAQTGLPVSPEPPTPTEQPENPTPQPLPEPSPEQNVANETVVKPTYASLVDPNEGTTLEFIPAADINGVKCGKVDFEDIKEEVNYWHNAVLCCILGANPPLAVIEGYYIKITKSAMSLIKQQSKAEWIGYGDECSRYFMAKIKQRKAMTCIYQLKDKHSQWVQGFNAVADIITEYYTDLLGRKGTQRHQVQPQAVQYGHTLTLEQQINLCKPFTDQEIKQALFSIPDYKSPGPDGFNSGFFKASWKHTNSMVCQAIQEFFRTGVMPNFYAETKLVMIPKTHSPDKASDFRPISCCNVIYKTITKLLCSRIKGVLPTIILESQGAFVPGRELLHNVLLCQDLTRGYNRKFCLPSCILKVDLHKAFDSVH